MGRRCARCAIGEVERTKQRRARQRWREGYQDPEYKRLRALVQRRMLCEVCGGPGEEVDHIVPLSRGGRNVLGNLRLLCRGCHRAKRR